MLSSPDGGCICVFLHTVTLIRFDAQRSVCAVLTPLHFYHLVDFVTILIPIGCTRPRHS